MSQVAMDVSWQSHVGQRECSRCDRSDRRPRPRDQLPEMPESPTVRPPRWCGAASGAARDRGDGSGHRDRDVQ